MISSTSFSTPTSIFMQPPPTWLHDIYRHEPPLAIQNAGVSCVSPVNMSGHTLVVGRVVRDTGGVNALPHLFFGPVVDRKPGVDGAPAAAGCLVTTQASLLLPGTIRFGRMLQAG